jgi:uncharacterized protein DUF6186
VTSSWGYAVWAVLAGVAVLLWVLSYRVSKRPVVARPSAVLSRLASDPWLRVPLLLAWAFVGWHLFAR